VSTPEEIKKLNERVKNLTDANNQIGKHSNELMAQRDAALAMVEQLKTSVELSELRARLSEAEKERSEVEVFGYAADHWQNKTPETNLGRVVKALQEKVDRILNELAVETNRSHELREILISVKKALIGEEETDKEAYKALNTEAPLTGLFIGMPEEVTRLRTKTIVLYNDSRTAIARAEALLRKGEVKS